MEYLQKIEKDVQAEWEAGKVYEEDAPLKGRKTSDEKFLATFPFPYMNGKLHLGHTFSLSKCEVNISCKYEEGNQERDTVYNLDELI